MHAYILFNMHVFIAITFHSFLFYHFSTSLYFILIYLFQPLSLSSVSFPVPIEQGNPSKCYFYRNSHSGTGPETASTFC